VNASLAFIEGAKPAFIEGAKPQGEVECALVTRWDNKNPPVPTCSAPAPR
jgi:hypothetical protein